jgi:putative SOS response-associated peptidase YedK
MCYDISFTVQIRTLADIFPDLIIDDQLEIDYSKAVHIMGHAYAEHPIMYVNRDDMKTHLTLMEWGCIPFYVKDEKAFVRQRAFMLNARSERILEDTKSYWYKIRNRRCLIPMNGIYEHRKITGWKKKVPYHVAVKNEPVFFVPGLYSVAELPDKETGEVVKRLTYTLITRDANDLMKRIHNDGENKWRMPLFLHKDQAQNWLREDLTPEEYKDILNYELPADQLEAWPVYSIRGKDGRTDGKEKNAPYEWEGLPALETEEV